MQTKIKTTLIILTTLTLLILAISFALKLIYDKNNEQTSLEKAISIIDGDTFDTASGERVRLLCVDTPEIGDKGYEEASAYLSALILGKDVTIKREGLDKYNRTLAWISIDIEVGVREYNVLVNKAIVDNGFGEIFEYGKTNCNRME